MKCRKCGNKTARGDTFCGVCGAGLKKSRALGAVVCGGAVILLAAAAALLFWGRGAKLGEFSADEIYFVAGERDEAVFSVRLSGSHGSVELYKDGRPDGGMTDPDGDGVYTAAREIFYTGEAAPSYSARAGRSVSEAVVIHVFDAPTEADAELVIRTGEKLAGFGEDIAAAEKFLRGLMTEGSVIAVEATEGGVTAKLASGMTVVFAPAPEGSFGGSEGMPDAVVTVQPVYSEFKSNCRRSSVFSELFGLNGEEYQDQASRMAGTIDGMDYSAMYADENVTLSAIKALPARSAVFWCGHGAPGGSLGCLVCTGEKFALTTMVLNFEDLVKDRVVVSSGKLLVSYRFIEEYCGDLSGSFFWFNTCFSGNDRLLAGALLDKGATAVVGFTGSVMQLYAYPLWDMTIDYMLSPQPDGKEYYSLESALELAKAFYGESDAGSVTLGGRKYSYNGGGSTAVIFGGSAAKNYRLGVLHAPDESFSDAAAAFRSLLSPDEPAGQYCLCDVDFDGQKEFVLYGFSSMADGACRVYDYEDGALVQMGSFACGGGATIMANASEPGLIISVLHGGLGADMWIGLSGGRLAEQRKDEYNYEADGYVDDKPGKGWYALDMFPCDDLSGFTQGF